jgi:hypothetical protein
MVGVRRSPVNSLDGQRTRTSKRCYTCRRCGPNTNTTAYTALVLGLYDSDAACGRGIALAIRIAHVEVERWKVSSRHADLERHHRPSVAESDSSRSHQERGDDSANASGSRGICACGCRADAGGNRPGAVHACRRFRQVDDRGSRGGREAIYAATAGDAPDAEDDCAPSAWGAASAGCTRSPGNAECTQAPCHAKAASGT